MSRKKGQTYTTEKKTKIVLEMLKEELQKQLGKSILEKEWLAKKYTATNGTYLSFLE